MLEIWVPALLAVWQQQHVVQRLVEPMIEGDEAGAATASVHTWCLVPAPVAVSVAITASSFDVGRSAPLGLQSTGLCSTNVVDQQGRLNIAGD